MVTLVCMYGIGLPLALYLGFKRHLNLVGFWEGFLAAMITLDVIVIFLLVCADWNIGVKKQNEKAVDAESPLKLNESREDSLREKLLDQQ